MTQAEKKAEELVDKFLEQNQSWDFDMTMAKQCALIACRFALDSIYPLELDEDYIIITNPKGDEIENIIKAIDKL